MCVGSGGGVLPNNRRIWSQIHHRIKLSTMREPKAFPSRMTGTKTYQYSGYVQLMAMQTPLAINMKTMKIFRVQRNLFLPSARTIFSSSIVYLDFLRFVSIQLDLCRAPVMRSAVWLRSSSTFSLDSNSSKSTECDKSLTRELSKCSGCMGVRVSGFARIVEIEE